jgi:hypothetical protein
MKYEVPKIVESNPVVMGLDVRVVLAVILMALLFLFVVFTRPLLSMVFPVMAITVIKIKSRFKRKGEFKAFLSFSPICISKMKKIHDITSRATKIS